MSLYKKVAVIGYGTEGRDAVDYWLGQGAEVEVRDKNDAIPVPSTVTSVVGGAYLSNLDSFDMIVRSPGVHPDLIVAANQGVEVLAKVTTSTNIFLEHVATNKIVAVTGTKGKGTTATLVQKMLDADGKSTYLGGNIGVPLLRSLAEITSDDWVVLELSSFQLYDLRHAVPHAVCLHISPEHLNWHSDVEDYITAKTNLFRLQTKDGRVAYNALSASATQAASASKGEMIPWAVPAIGEQPPQDALVYADDHQLYYQNDPLIAIKDIALPGRHNLENIAAALAILGPLLDDFKRAAKTVLTNFSGLHDHLELIADIAGVRYYNDTYSTAPDAAIAAAEAFEAPKVMLIGGIDKGLDLSEFIDQLLVKELRGLIILDVLKPYLQKLLDERRYKDYVVATDMPHAVQAAQAMAQPGDVVLLSPGCAGNGGWFTDKLDRGHQFNEAVSNLK